MYGLKPKEQIFILNLMMRPALGLAAFGVLLAILTVHVLAMDDELMYLSSQSDLFSSSTVEDLGGEIASDELHDYSTKGAGPGAPFIL